MTTIQPKKYARKIVHPPCSYIMTKGKSKNNPCNRPCLKMFDIDGSKQYRCGYHTPERLLKSLEHAHNKYTPRFDKPDILNATPSN